MHASAAVPFACSGNLGEWHSLQTKYLHAHTHAHTHACACTDTISKQYSNKKQRARTDTSLTHSVTQLLTQSSAHAPARTHGCTDAHFALTCNAGNAGTHTHTLQSHFGALPDVHVSAAESYFINMHPVSEHPEGDGAEAVIYIKRPEATEFCLLDEIDIGTELTATQSARLVVATDRSRSAWREPNVQAGPINACST